MGTDVRVGAVAIGRNEGERLRRCLAALQGQVRTIVYVDSGSTDGSREHARSLGVDVVDLDLSTPFTAARARNAGVARLLEVVPDTAFVQFLDGDCELSAGWIDSAAARLREVPKLAAVAGRLRERHVEGSVYNRLCDVEWNTEVGRAEWCGGNVMMRADAFREAGGFDPTLIAGEEPDLCLRLRRHGWAIERLPEDMASHDAAMTHFSQWWKRCKRAGHAFAEGAWRHGDGPERYFVREARRAWLWGAAVPVAALGLALPTAGLSLALSAVGYARSALHARSLAQRRGYDDRTSMLYALFTTLGKFPEAQGALRFHALRLMGRKSPLIEYKKS